MDHGVLRVWAKLDDVGFTKAGSHSSQDIRIGRSSGVSGEYLKRKLTRQCPRIGNGIGDGRVDDAPVIQAVSAPQDGLALPGQIPGKASPRSKIVAVIRERGRAGQQGVGDLRIGHLLVLVPQAEVQSQPRMDSPIVLKETVKVPGGESEGGRPYPLGVAGVATRGGHRRSAQLRSAIDCGSEIGDEIHPIVVNVFAAFLKEVVFKVMYAIDVPAKLEQVPPPGVAHRVSELGP